MTEQRILGILLAVGLLLVAGIFAVLDEDKTKPDQPLSETVAVAPPASSDASEPATTTGALPVEPSAKPGLGQAGSEPSDAPWDGKILVSKRPVEVLAAPSSSASAMYGFPAGRPFRVIGREAGFVRIQDVKSGAGGWIEEAALAPAPPAPTVAATPATGSAKAIKKASPNPKLKSVKPRTAAETDTAATEPEPVERRKGGLFGGNGPLGGLFGAFGGR